MFGLWLPGEGAFVFPDSVPHELRARLAQVQAEEAAAERADAQPEPEPEPPPSPPPKGRPQLRLVK